MLGRVEADEHGPLVVLVGGMHGNEPAGVTAIRRCFGQLAGAGPGAVAKGRLLGLLGNPEAFRRGVRQVDEDLNRAFVSERVARAVGEGGAETVEGAFAKTLYALLREEVAAYRPTEVVVLDLHTTSADGGDFVVLGDGPGSEALTRDLGVPVVLGLTDVLTGTLCGYLNAERLGVPTRAFAYEAGAHDGSESPGRAFALVAALLERIGLVEAGVLDCRGVDLDAEPGRPPLTRVVFRLAIEPGSAFVMMPGFRNFDAVQAGQVVAVLDGESVALERGGYMLMPLYQGEGRDGFFLVE